VKFLRDKGYSVSDVTNRKNISYPYRGNIVALPQARLLNSYEHLR
jgi:hypothetical protein